MKIDLRLSQNDVILNPDGSGQALIQNLHSLFKFGDTGSGSGMTKLSLSACLTSFWDSLRVDWKDSGRFFSAFTDKLKKT